MEQMLDEATSMHRQEALHKGLAFDVSPSPTSPAPRLLLGDSSQLRKIISNLCANAVQYTEHGGVRLEWGLEEKIAMEGEETAAAEMPVDSVAVVFQVCAISQFSHLLYDNCDSNSEDTGRGMSSSTLEALFRQLEEVSAENEVEQQAPSIGLGLAVVSNIIKSLNGQLLVESKPGSGTSFSINVPLRLPQPTPPRMPSGAPPRPATPQERWEMDTLLSAITSSHMAPPQAPVEKATPDPRTLGASSPTPSASRAPSATPRSDSQRESTRPRVTPLKALVVDVSCRSAFGARSRWENPRADPKRSGALQDEPINRRILEKIFTVHGHEVATCENGMQALRLLEHDGEWDLVVLDLQVSNRSP